MYRRLGKRAIDISLSLLALAVLWPIMSLLALFLWWHFKQFPIFRQARPGKDTKLFTLYKFRSMYDVRDASAVLLPDDRRTSKLGCLLRKSSLDEIPQLWNVLKGDMSLIGPRPLLPEYLPFYNLTQAKRHSLRPGITGWAQVHGRNALSWEQKFSFDVQYAECYSFSLDLKILLMTLFQAVRSCKSEIVLVEKFRG